MSSFQRRDVDLTRLRGLVVQARSRVVRHGVELAFAFARDDGGPVVVARADDRARLDAFEGERHDDMVVGPTSARNAAALRAHLPWLRPQPLGLRASVGLGDRLGLATPGHVRALRASDAAMAPVFAQQSIREMDRTGRSAQAVMDDATWGLFEEGWCEPFGADADHVKTPADIDRCLACGYTLFTIDPSDHVGRSTGRTAPPEASRDAVARYAGSCIDLGHRELTLAHADLVPAAGKYAPAIAHIVKMHEHLRTRAGNQPYEVEISLDEVDSPMSHAEHVYLARELQRAGVAWVSLAPRFVGRFEKGIDYIGDVSRFADHFAGHVAIAERMGPYKLSLHSGSDKLTIYPVVAATATGRVHVKTSGTSYLEALRTLTAVDAGLFRRVYACALGTFARDSASYRVTPNLRRLPDPRAVSDDELARLLDDAAARRVLHVTFGSVLTGELGPRLMSSLRAARKEYAAGLEAHLLRHLEPFAR